MNQQTRFFVRILAFLMFSAAPVAAALENSPAELSGGPQSRVVADYGRLPLYFIENRGQVDRQVQFYAQGPGQRLAVTSRDVRLSLGRKKGKPDQIRLTPLGMLPGVEIQALDPQEARFNYLLGKDQSRWRTDVPSYGAVLYREAYPGIDLKFYGNGRQMEYDLIIRPGADLSRVKFRYGGVAGLKVDGEGNLTVRLRDGGLLVQKKPLVYQEIDGRRVAREGRFRLLKPGGREYGFVVAAYDKTRPLVIDPVLVYSTYFGGSANDNISGVAVDQQGCVYMTGSTDSTNFPGYPSDGSGIYCFVTKLNQTGTALVYSTVFGTGDGQYPNAIAVDGNGNACVTGNAQNNGLPRIPDPPICTYQGGQDAFVIKFNAAGNTMLYSTYLGGTDEDIPWSIAVDGTGQAYVTGQTKSINYITTTGALHESPIGGYDCFVSKINVAGTALVYSTYLGGSLDDYPAGIAVDGEGNAYITGQTRSSADFTTLTPMRPWAGPPTDAFVAKLNPDGTAMLNFTYLGGSLPAGTAADGGSGIALDQAGNIYVTGYTNSTNFPTVNAFQKSKGGGVHDAFVAKIDSAWSGLVYSTYLGGSDQDDGQKIAIDGAGSAYVMGTTKSGSNFPIKNSLQPYRAISSSFGSIFVSKFSPSGSTLVYSTFLGGSLESTSSLYALAVDRSGSAYVAGGTRSTNYPTKNALYPTYLGGFTDGFVTKIAAGNSSAALDLLLLGDE